MFKSLSITTFLLPLVCLGYEFTTPFTREDFDDCEVTESTRDTITCEWPNKDYCIIFMDSIYIACYEYKKSKSSVDAVSDNNGLLIGVIVGAVLLAVICVTAAYVCYARR